MSIADAFKNELNICASIQVINADVFKNELNICASIQVINADAFKNELNKLRCYTSDQCRCFQE